MMKNDANKTINILGTEYVYDTLSDDIKQMIALRTQWVEESKEIKRNYLKTNGAIRDITREIDSLVTQRKDTSPYMSSVNQNGTEVVEFK